MAAHRGDLRKPDTRKAVFAQMRASSLLRRSNQKLGGSVAFRRQRSAPAKGEAPVLLKTETPTLYGDLNPRGSAKTDVQQHAHEGGKSHGCFTL